MALDRDLLVFHGKVMTVARDEFGASCSEKLVDQLYAQYLAAGKPEVRQWLIAELAKWFLCVGDRPSWVEEEPAWPSIEGKPMVFIGQIGLPENEVTRKHLTWATVVYVFGARVPYRDGYKTEYRTVEQSCALGGTGVR